MLIFDLIEDKGNKLAILFLNLEIIFETAVACNVWLLIIELPLSPLPLLPDEELPPPPPPPQAVKEQRATINNIDHLVNNANTMDRINESYVATDKKVEENVGGV